MADNTSVGLYNITTYSLVNKQMIIGWKANLDKYIVLDDAAVQIWPGKVHLNTYFCKSSKQDAEENQGQDKSILVTVHSTLLDSMPAAGGV